MPMAGDCLSGRAASPSPLASFGRRSRVRLDTPKRGKKKGYGAEEEMSTPHGRYVTVGRFVFSPPPAVYTSLFAPSYCVFLYISAC